MLKIFVFMSRSKTTHIASFLFSDSCFSVAQIPQISLLALTVASLDNHLVLHARCNCRSFAFIVQQSDASPGKPIATVKQQSISIIALKCFRSFIHHTVQVCGRKITGRSEAVRMTMHRYHTYNFRFQILCQEIVSAYNIAAICCNSHVQENMLSSNRFTSRQNHILAFRIQGVIAKFQGVILTPKNGLKNTDHKVQTSLSLSLATFFRKNSLFTFYSLQHHVQIRHRRDYDEQNAVAVV